MATPRVGVDGRRRLTVTVTVADEDADLLWAVAYMANGNAAAGVSKWARGVLVEALHRAAGDAEVRAVVALLAAARAETQTFERRSGRHLRALP